MSDSSIPALELDRAAALANDFLASSDKDPALYRLVVAENMLAGADASQTRWRLGFKLRELLPDGPSGKIGKGGDFYLHVDLATGTVTWAKGGH